MTSPLDTWQAIPLTIVNWTVGIFFITYLTSSLILMISFRNKTSIDILVQFSELDGYLKMMNINEKFRDKIKQ